MLTAQITVLFSVLHNAIYNRLDGPSIREKLPPHLQDPRQQFRVARDVVTLTYRRIVFNDLLRRLLDPAVYNFLLTNGPIEADLEAKRGVPLEFSHAAYRIGHAMVRSGYEMNDGVDKDARTFLSLSENLALGTQRYSQDLPLIKDWYAQWSKFFETGGNTPQPSRRLGPSIVPLLGRDHYFPNQDGAAGATLPGGLMYRDLVRGEEEVLATPAALAAYLGGALGPDFDAEAHVKDIQNKVVGWLSGAGFSLEETLEIASTPPLIFFLMVEAWLGPDQGKRLGPLGSLVIGEVFFRSQGEALDAYEQDHHLQSAAQVALGRAIPQSMTELHEFVDDWSPLEYRPLPIV